MLEFKPTPLTLMETSLNSKSSTKIKGKKCSKKVRFASDDLTSFIGPAFALSPSECTAQWWNLEDYRFFKANAETVARQERLKGKLDDCIALAMRHQDSSELVRWSLSGSARGLERRCGEKYSRATDILVKFSINVVLRTQHQNKKQGFSQFHRLEERLRSGYEKVTATSKKTRITLWTCGC